MGVVCRAVRGIVTNLISSLVDDCDGGGGEPGECFFNVWSDDAFNVWSTDEFNCWNG
jgi:hypothetical protein